MRFWASTLPLPDLDGVIYNNLDRATWPLAYHCVSFSEGKSLNKSHLIKHLKR